MDHIRKFGKINQEGEIILAGAINTERLSLNSQQSMQP